MNKPMTLQEIRWDGMTITIELVTPEIAATWLAKNKANRRLRNNAVSAYARAMTNGDWQPKPMAICFTADGYLGNGQHTLSAIIESGASQVFMIARDVPIESIAAMDAGIRRTYNDIAHFVGAKFTSRLGAIAKVIVLGPQSNEVLLFDEVFSMYQSHKDVIDWVCSLPHSGEHRIGNSAAVTGVMARAAHTQDRDRIAEFYAVLKTGIGDGARDSAATRLRDFLRTHTSSSGAGRVEHYQRTEYALDLFLRYQPMSKLYGTDKELFPIPA